MIDISGLDKAKVLVALFNGSKQQGLGFLGSRGTGSMTYEKAKEVLKTQESFDYLYGRVLKIDLSGEFIDPFLFDRDNGEGRAKKIIDTLKGES